MKSSALLRASALALVLAGNAAFAQSLLNTKPSKTNFNFNPTPCPQAAQYSALPSTSVDTFSDGTPLPSCGGTQGGFAFKMVWLGSIWAKVGSASRVDQSGVPSVNVLPPCLTEDYAYDDRATHMVGNVTGVLRYKDGTFGVILNAGGKQWTILESHEPTAKVGQTLSIDIVKPKDPRLLCVKLF